MPLMTTKRWRACLNLVTVGGRTFAVVAAQLQEAVEDDTGAHRVADQRHGPVPMAAAHEHMRKQPPRLQKTGVTPTMATHVAINGHTIAMGEQGTSNLP